ncbi:MAG: glycosyltransferase family 4 protein [Anaerolineae bacterium]|nr:glycosyltransferase family 4 protein [Anaerolineae bacterium]
MKIAIVHPTFEAAVPLSRGGSISSFSVITDEIAQRLANQHQVLVFSRGDKNLPAHEQIGNITYQRFSASFAVEDKVVKAFRVIERLTDVPLRKKPFFTSPAHYYLYAREVGLACRDAQVDVIHVIIFAPLIPTIRALNPHARIILHMENEWVTQMDHGRAARALRDTDCIVSCSDFVSNRIKASFPEYANRAFTVHNGVDIGRFPLRSSQPPADPARPRRIVYVGRLSAEKGVHLLIKAFEQVVKEIPNAHLDIIGPANSPAYEYMVPISDDPNVLALKPYFTKWLKRGDTHYLDLLQAMVPPHLTDRIFFLGQRPNTEVRNMLESADVFCFAPIWHEPFGIPVVEAMASGVPVVTSASGGIMELVEDGRTGIVVPRADVDALAKGLIRALTDPELVARIVPAARQRAEQLFSWDTSVRQLEKYYQGGHPTLNGQIKLSPSL